MKKFLVPFLVAAPILFVPAACSTMHEILDVPGAVAEDVGGVIPGDAPAEEAAPAVTPEVIGKAAETGTTLITGNTALAAIVGSVVTLLASIFLKRKKEA